MYEFISATRLSDGDVLMQVGWTPNWFYRLLGYSPRIYDFREECTVWHHHPSGVRAGTEMEFILAAWWTKWAWNIVE